MSNAQTLRQIHIKTGVVKRLFKEISMYADEAQQQEKVLQGLKEKEADGADIRNAERVLKDSQQMIPRTKLSLEEGYNALQDLVHALKGEAEITESKEYQAAVEQLILVDEAKKAASGPNEA